MNHNFIRSFGFALLLLGSICHDVDAASNLQISEEGELKLGGNFKVKCHGKMPPYWTRQGDRHIIVPPLDESATFGETLDSTMTFESLGLEDIGNYTCHSDSKKTHEHFLNYQLKFEVQPKINLTVSDNIKLKGSRVTFKCKIFGFPLHENLVWMHEGVGVITSPSQGLITTSPNLTSTFSTLKLENITHKQNGSYSCRYGNQISKVDLRVTAPPELKFELIKVVGKAKIFLKWMMIFDGNLPITHLELKFTEGQADLRSTLIPISNLSQFILDELHPSTNYSSFTLIATNKAGSGNATSDTIVTTLAEDPKLVPTITVNGNTFNSITIRWSEEHSEFFQRYSVNIQGKNSLQVSEGRENPYMIENLEPETSYVIKIQACSEYTGECNPFSNEVKASTLPGTSSAPVNLIVQCFFNQTTHKSSIHAVWGIPQNPRGQIIEYTATLFGNATYRDSVSLNNITENIGPIDKTVGITQVEFTNQPPNTKYYLSVCAKTRSKICGEVVMGTCRMPPSIPNREELSKVNWKTVAGKSQFYFMVTMPYISQRNGSVCCFRIVVVRLVEVDSFEQKLGSPGELKLSSYDQVHNSSDGGAYVAELLDPNGQGKRIIMIGDEDPGRESSKLACDSCFHFLPSDTSQQGTNGHFRRPQMFHINSIPSSKPHRKRHASSANSNYVVYDGPLHSESTYTAYLDALVVSDGNEQIVAHSNYFSPLKPTRRAVETPSLSSFLIGTVLVALVFVFLAVICVMRWRRKEPGDEEYGFSHSLQQLCRRLRGQQWVPSESTVEMVPIPKEEIISAFLERHRDEDLGFGQEFENLPDRFSDRSSHESDKRDNSGKNRYPDIKAYDQTRVRLLVPEGSHSSDYINANYVVGYKERKRFICAQGPMEATVVDWWRLVWEQKVTLILMLTNTEEYNKTKCAKYWPSEGSSLYGEITVTHNSEKEFSDYLVRNLKLKRSRPSEQGDEERLVYQYHYLVWKDFMAPEYPVGIIRFIKRFNEVYSPEKGPILVHCSAGVGRTGTLVALDSLLDQLVEENCVSIFNTICDLRHQRNFLVQSLKQYIFIYRALMEAAQFGDTEIKLSEFKSALERLKGCEDGKTVSRMQEEFDKLSNVIEDRKAFSQGALEENRCRNRYDNVIPYDRCRVILSPLANSRNEICTYINASFIEGYDNTEQFIMTQDPLENTIGDFWRMIVEQNVRTIVMFSEIGEENCPRYWPEKDQETAHDYIKVMYMQSQSFPFYYKREFTVTNSRTDDSYLVTQFQYNGWPVGAGEVPESTRGLVELVDTTLKHQDSIEINTGPSIVHCSDGAQRSCIFVALAILVKQMMTESRVDVFTVVRKLRSQRQNLFQNVAQYDLVYRGLLTYSELHMTNGVDAPKP